MGALEVREVASEIENPSRGKGIYQRASCRLDHRNGGANRLYLAKPNTWGIADRQPIDSIISPVPRPIR